IALVEPDARVSHSRYWDPEAPKQPRTKRFIDKAGILQGIVQADFVQSMKSLAGGVKVKLEGETWLLGINRSKRRVPFEVHSHFYIMVRSLVNRCADRFSALFFQRFQGAL